MSYFIGKSIILVEDEFLLAMLFQDMLEDMGLEVVGPFRNVSGALDALKRSKRVDMGLLDIDLGDETSLHVADALSERDIPFMFATGFGSTPIDGYDDAEVLSKPFTEHQLLECLRSLLSRAAAA